MRKVVLFMYITLDGFVAGPNGEFDDYEPSEEEHQFANELFSSADAVLFGRKTYEVFVAYWDSLDVTDASIPAGEIEFARIFRKMIRVVFSRTLDSVADNAVLIQDNLAAEVGKLKQQLGRDLLLVCGPELLASPVQDGLVDEYLLLVKPTVLGRGTALFGAILGKLQLNLLSTRVFGSGVVMHHYQV